MVTTTTPFRTSRGRVVVVALADRERAAVDPEHDRELLARLAGRPVARRKDVQVETVLACRTGARRGSGLGAVVGELGRVERSGPGRVGLGRRQRRSPTGGAA